MSTVSVSTVSGGGPSDGSGSLSNDDGDELPDDKSVSSGDGLSGDLWLLFAVLKRN